MQTFTSYRSLLVGTLSLLLVGSLSAAQAATVSYNSPFGFALSPGSQVVNLPQWDPSLFPGQTLVSVTLDMTANIGANITAENDGAIAGSMGVDLTGVATASSGALSLSAVILQSAGPVAVAGTDGVGGSGPDFADFGSVSGANSDSDTLFAALGAYIGNGSFATNVFGSGGFAATGVSDSTIQVSSFGANGAIMVTYEYVAVPEPASIVLCGLGACGLALAAVRRRRRK